MPEKQESTTFSGLDSEVIARIQRLLRQGMRGRVEAMKLYMRETGVGLKDAKSALDREMEFLGIPISIRKLI